MSKHTSKHSAVVKFIGAVLLITVTAVLVMQSHGAIEGVRQWWQQQAGILQNIGVTGAAPDDEKKQVAYKFAVLSDSHEDTTVFPKIAQQINQRQDLAFVVHLGDLTNAGSRDKLTEAKAILDQIAIPVYVLPGDHDLNWFPQHDLTNFLSVFGQDRSYYSFNHHQEHFILIDNSDSQNGISQEQWQWLEADLNSHRAQSIYVFMSTPISNPYLPSKVMGSQSQVVKQQAGVLGQLLDRYNVKAIFAGDAHAFSQYRDKQTDLPIITAGAAGSDKNLLPLYLIVEIFTDGSYNVTSIPYRE